MIRAALICTFASLVLAACGSCGPIAQSTTVSTACSAYAARNHLDPAVACDGDAATQSSDAGVTGR